MPEIFLATDPSAAKRPSESSPKSQPAASATEAGSGPDSFSRTLQAQMDERRVGERRALDADAASRDDKRPSEASPATTERDRSEGPTVAKHADGSGKSQADAEEPAQQAEATPAQSDATPAQAPATAALPALPAADGNGVPAPIAAPQAGQITIAVDAADAATTKLETKTDGSPNDAAAEDAGPDSGNAGERREARLTQAPSQVAAAPGRIAAAAPTAEPEAVDDGGRPPTPNDAQLLREVHRLRPAVPALRPADTAMAAATEVSGRSGERGVELPQPAAQHNPVQAAIRQTATPNAPAPTAFVATPAGQPGFADDVGQRVMLFARRGESKAELILTPPQLGRVEVSLTISAEQATAQFVANSQSARDALEQAMPRLREMLAEAGIQLGQSSVGTRSEQHAGDGRQGARYHGGDHISNPADAVRNGARPWTTAATGLIDTFA